MRFDDRNSGETPISDATSFTDTFPWSINCIRLVNKNVTDISESAQIKRTELI